MEGSLWEDKARNWRLAVNSCICPQPFSSDQSLQDLYLFLASGYLTENHKLQFCPWESPFQKPYVLALPVYLADIMCAIRAFLTSVNFRVAIIFNYSRWKTTQNVNSNPPSPRSPSLSTITTALLFPLPTPKRLDLLFLDAHISWCDPFLCHSFFPITRGKKILSHFRTFKSTCCWFGGKHCPLHTDTTAASYLLYPTTSIKTEGKNRQNIWALAAAARGAISCSTGSSCFCHAVGHEAASPESNGVSEGFYYWRN